MTPTWREAHQYIKLGILVKKWNGVLICDMTIQRKVIWYIHGSDRETTVKTGVPLNSSGDTVVM